MAGGTATGGALGNSDLQAAKNLILEGLALHPVTAAMAEIKATPIGFRNAAHVVLDMALNELAEAVNVVAEPVTAEVKGGWAPGNWLVSGYEEPTDTRQS